MTSSTTTTAAAAGHLRQAEVDDELKYKIARLERELEQARMHLSSTSLSGHARSPGGSTEVHENGNTHPHSSQGVDPQQQQHSTTTTETSGTGGGVRPFASILTASPEGSSAMPAGLKAHALRSPVNKADTDIVVEQSRGLLIPGWHQELPDRALMDHLVDIYFQHVPVLPRMFHYETFKARMALPATHPDFPNIAVLHSICSVTATYTARVTTCNPESRPWVRVPQNMEEPQREEDFGIRHSHYAWRAINTQLGNGVHVYQCLQALVILAHHCHMYNRWFESWITLGTAGRLLAPLGLNVKERPGPGTGPNKGAMVSPAVNDIDREERRALLWIMVLNDIQISACTGWGGSVQIDEIVRIEERVVGFFLVGPTLGD